jgi:hypothetical protein
MNTYNNFSYSKHTLFSKRGIMAIISKTSMVCMIILFFPFFLSFFKVVKVFIYSAKNIHPKLNHKMKSKIFILTPF